MRLKLDTRKADQQLREQLICHMEQEKLIECWLSKGDQQKEGKRLELTSLRCGLNWKTDKENWFDFDVLIATPEMMPSLGK